MKKQVFYITLLFFTLLTSYAQPSRLGIPFIRNYTVEEYKADNQNWGIIQDHRGIMYFANSWGILEFNGSDWRIIASANNNSTIRSLAIDNKGRIYAGAFGEFGFLDINNVGKVWYHPLSGKIPAKHKKFNDTWQIFPTSKGVFFQSSFNTYWYVNDTVKVISYQNECRKSFIINDRIFLKFSDGLRELVDDKVVDIPDGDLFGPMYIAFMIPLTRNKILVGTETNGLYIYDFQKLTPFRTSVDDFLKKNKIFCGLITPEGLITIGTVHDGLMVLDNNGLPLLHLNTDNGLQNNTILSMRNDNLGNLWLAMDHGIDYVELASPFTKVRTKEIDGNIYSICKSGENIYIATHHGLFYQNWDFLKKSIDKIEEFKQIKDVSEINWNLSLIDGTLFLGHDKGAYVIKDNKAIQISDVKGGWIFKKLEGYGNTIIEGTYNGLVIFKKEKDEWKQHKVLNINESCRVVEQDDAGNIWLTSGYNGVYRIKLNENADSIVFMKLYGTGNGLPESIYFGVFKVKGEIVIGTQKGVYSYSAKTDRFEQHKLFYPYFKENHVRKLIEDKKGNIWYMAAKNTGYLKLTSDGSYLQIETPFQKIEDKQLPGFENISFVDDDNAMMGTKYGIINFNQSYKRDYYAPFQTILDQVLITTERDSQIFQNVVEMPELAKKEKLIVLPYKQNALRFKFSATYYENTQDIQYKYILEGFDDDWSNWVKKNEKEYTNIPEGNYIFKVKSKNIYNYESTEATIKITILPPWYRTTWAYIAYAIIGLIGLWLIIFIKNLQFKKEKHELEKEKLKAIRLKMTEHMKEKLQDELKNKNKELASTTMNLVQKNETIIKIRDKLSYIVETLPEKEQKKLRSLEKMIDDEINDDSYWEQFEQHFNQIHDDFIKRFKTEHKTLTHRDLKMCAYLRMNLSNKEIASLLNITLRGVEASRLRLRKKLDLEKDTLLTEYILRY